MQAGGRDASETRFHTRGKFGILLRRWRGKLESWLPRIGTSADELTATGAAGTVFPKHGFRKINACDVGDGREPSQHVREFLHALLVTPVSQGRCQFADFFH
jgi:hypothetical protein